jgi:tetratricopeptide (TPR) repeat protein
MSSTNGVSRVAIAALVSAIILPGFLHAAPADEAVERARKAYERRQNEYYAANLAKALVAAGKSKQALGVVDEHVKRLKGKEAAGKLRSFRWRIVNVLAKAEMADEAIAMLEEMARETGPVERRIYSRLESVLRSQGRLDAYIEQTEKEAEADPDDFHKAAKAGMMYCVRGGRRDQWGRAVFWLEKARKLEPGNGGVYVPLVLCSYTAKEYDKAVTYGRILFEKFPEVAKWHDAERFATQSAVAAGDHEAALYFARRKYELHASGKYAANFKGPYVQQLIAHKKWPEAEKLSLELWKSEDVGHRWIAARALADIRRKQGKRAETLTWLNKGAAVIQAALPRREAGDVGLRLGDYYLGQDQPEKAIAAMTEWLGRVGAPMEALDLARRLAEVHHWRKDDAAALNVLRKLVAEEEDDSVRAHVLTVAMHVMADAADRKALVNFLDEQAKKMKAQHLRQSWQRKADKLRAAAAPPRDKPWFEIPPP